MRHVSGEEAAEVRELLDGHGIDCYETSAGLLGISLAAIWVRDDRQFAHARELLDEYQHERQQRIRRQLEQAQQRGEAPTAFDKFRDSPVRFLGSLLMVALVLYLSLRFFFSF